MAPVPRARTAQDAALHAGKILRIYRNLAKTGTHLLAPILGNRSPRQWAHYPDDDAIDARRRFQWYYHSHSPADRPGSIEHGHFHVFARTDARRSLINQDAEAAFLEKLGSGKSEASTRHLLAIGLSPVGVPISLFTVNRWVTGDQLLSGESSIRLLQSMTLDTGYRTIDALIASLIHLHWPQILTLFRNRDRVLLGRARRGAGTLDDESVEVLSEVPVHLDRALSRALRRTRDPSTVQPGSAALASFRRRSSSCR